ncbi:mannosyltransferase family protein, partial [Streptomyces acidiscabies]|uniref:mannosyltransferase family protein n=1 Tax=Streptomyces acidiscabies TaxID=42234 RepID=UPI0002893FBE
MTHATTTAAALAPPPPAVARRPAVRRRPGLLGALGLFVLARLAGAGVLAGIAWAAGKRPLRLLGHSWDSRWYLGIAEHGYGRTLRFGPDVVHSDLAFFPLYPALVRAVTAVTPLGAGSAGLLVSWTAAAVAACGIYAVTRHLRGPAVAAATVLLWGLLPHSVVLSMAYTEPVLTAFAAWALYAVLTGRWVWAGALAAAAGVSRPNGFAVAAAVVVAGGCEAVRAWGWGMAGAEGRPPLGRGSGGTLARGWGRGMAGAEGRAPRGHGFGPGSGGTRARGMAEVEGRPPLGRDSGPGSEGSRAREGGSTGAWPSRAWEDGTEVSRPGGGPGLGEAVRARGCV